MATKPKFQAIRGTRDLLPPETSLWIHVEQTAHSVFHTFGFGEIRLPIFEVTELFARSIGEDTDVVGKEMYTFSDSPDSSDSQKDLIKKLVDLGLGVDVREVEKAFGEISLLATRHSPLATSVSLRPEATASVCRAYIEHNLQQLPQPVKLYYIGPMFRRERPQKGRYRQFYQIGAEVLEAARPDASRDAAKEILKDAITDAEVIEMVMTFFDRLGLSGVQLDINSIGHAAENCRRGYVARLKAALEKVKDKLGADSQRRIETNPLRVLDSKLEHEQAIIATLPKIADHLCDDCKAHYAALKRQLQLRGVLFRENWRLVRGLDYYMRTTFEITAQGLGSQDAVCGGGRYDGLVELLGGPPTKGIGFAIGEDRLILSLQETARTQSSAAKNSAIAAENATHDARNSAPAAKNSPLATRHSPLLYIAWMGEHAYATAIRASKDLRNAGVSVELPFTELKLGKALERASKLGSRYALILGDNEVSEGLWTLKTLADGTQQKLTEPELLDFLKQM